ncbi:hypothetical protein [Maribacter sp. HTCC2170]|uniref:hypothetical protein n=1 Tax=Maribacter sp. (strain HTCC2170 / KCCM 42371) TaxID=313603 RepID=UPI0002E67F80|nr:hypothetical protein [Maribacter sp. HTCC2170]
MSLEWDYLFVLWHCSSSSFAFAGCCFVGFAVLGIKSDVPSERSEHMSALANKHDTN